MRAFSIKQKLMLITMASSTMALLLTASAFLLTEDMASRRAMVRDLSAQAQLLAAGSIAALSFDDTNAAAEYLRSLAAREHVTAACFYLETNRFAPAYLRNPEAPRTVPPHPGPGGWSFSVNSVSGFEPVRSDGTTVGWIYLASDLGALRARLWNYTGYLGLFGLVSLLAAYLLAARLQKVISRPISSLAATARAVTTEKNYSIRAHKESEDELGQLIDGFNEMLAQIQQRDDVLREINRELEARVAERTRNLQQQFDRLNLLNELAHAMAQRQDLDSIALTTLQHLEDRMPVDYSAALFYDPATETFRTIRRGPKSLPAAERLGIPAVVPIAHTLFAPCLRGEMVYVPDARQSPSLVTQKMAAEGFHTILAAPLMVEGKTFGVLVVHRRQTGGFTPAEREFIRNLSEHVALAAHQARLHQDLQSAYEELRQSQQAVMQQERLKALGQMASGIAHDINNTLSPIVGFADLIELTEENISADSRKHLRHIRTAGVDIARIVERLREFYRPRDRHEALTPVQLSRLAEQIVAMTRPRWRDLPQSRGVAVELRTELDPAAPEFAGSESEIRESLTNLILNAVDALPAGGVITLRTRAAQAGFKSGGQAVPHVIFEVKDTGMGMDEETRRRCLEPFFTTKGRHGTGMGLAMVYGVMERHDGQIEIDSEPGKGTTIRLIFPVSLATTRPDAAGTEPPPPGPFHVLCVNDEPVLRELIRKLLARDGHKVEVADGGGSGLAAFRAAQRRGEPFDVVITDLGMPYVNGNEVAAAVKRESPATPVILLTGWGAFMRDDRSASPHVDGVLSKPPRNNEIRAMLRQVVHKA